MTPYDQQFTRHRCARPRSSHITGATDPLSVAALPEQSLCATTVQAAPPLRGPAAPSPNPHESFSTFFPQSISRDSTDLLLVRNYAAIDDRAPDTRFSWTRLASNPGSTSSMLPTAAPTSLWSMSGTWIHKGRLVGVDLTNTPIERGRSSTGNRAIANVTHSLPSLQTDDAPHEELQLHPVPVRPPSFRTNPIAHRLPADHRRQKRLVRCPYVCDHRRRAIHHQISRQPLARSVAPDASSTIR